MSIPFYFAMEESEAAPPPGSRVAQLGFGFHEDGTLRLPAHRIPGAPAVINDRFLPAKAPEPVVLDQLADACANGCFLDFERSLNEVSAAIAVGLRKRLNANMTVPPRLHGLCPDADVQIPGLLCNHWERFTERIQAKYADRWVLEVIPWNICVRKKGKEETGCLPNAICGYRIENGTITYYDTEETVRRKLSVAEKHGCKAGISLLQEYRQLQNERAQFR